MLSSSRITLRAVTKEDLNSTYRDWLNDQEVNKYLETRFYPQTIETLEAYWKEHCDDPTSPWFAICLKEEKKHIGNIKLGPIRWLHRSADISLFIGDRKSWGKGYGSEAINLVKEWAFNELDLQKLSAGVYSENIGSRRAFEKCGFVLEGTLCREVVSGGRRQDVWRLGLTRNSWEKSK